MSTKAIREVLERSKRMWRDSDSVREIQSALAEVEAIERAAKDFSVNLGDCEPETWTLFCVIANQEP